MNCMTSVFWAACLARPRVQEDHDRTKADEQGKNYEDSTQADASMWRHTKRENLKDNR